MGRVCGIVEIHDMDASCCHIVDKKKFPTRSACPPDGNHGSSLDFCFMKTTDQRRDDMAVLRMIVVADAVEVRRHDAAVIGAVLAVVASTQFDARDFNLRIADPAMPRWPAMYTFFRTDTPYF